MTRVDFYYIPGSETEARFQFACRLVDKAFQHQCQLYIHCASAAEAQKLNEQLWTFQQNSFIPHAMVGDYPNNPPPIELGYQDKPAHHKDVVLNLTDKPLSFANEFTRCMEIIYENAAIENYAKQAEQTYVAQGLTINEHQLRK